VGLGLFGASVGSALFLSSSRLCDFFPLDTWLKTHLSCQVGSMSNLGK
jgi:hypothetical protein